MTKHMFQGEAELSAGRKDMDGAVIQPSSSPLDGITVRTFVSAGAHIDPLKECLRVQGGERKDKAKRKFVKALLARRRQEAPRAIEKLRMRDGKPNNHAFIKEVQTIAAMRKRFKWAAAHDKLSPVRATRATHALAGVHGPHASRTRVSPARVPSTPELTSPVRAQLEDTLLVDTLLHSNLASGPQFEAEIEKQLLELRDAVSDGDDEDDDY